MDDASKPVSSRQTGPHPRLQEIVLKHLNHPWRRPIADHANEPFEQIRVEMQSWGGPLIVDTGCGTGMSTRALAQTHPEALVIGIDKSIARLSRSAGILPPNARLIRMDLEDFWSLSDQARVRFARQCFFYPNPWPKPEHRLRRWPFHPVFPLLASGGGILELRTNWKVYADEFALAVGLVTGQTPEVTPWKPAVPETLFEKKYLAAGHVLWRCETTTVPTR